MTNEELRELAAVGVSLRIHTIEHQLASYHAEWPELFASPTPPQLLKVPMNGNGNGHRPAVAAPPATPPTTAEGFQPAKRRRKMSRKARAAISAAQKARWAKQKATGKRTRANA